MPKNMNEKTITIEGLSVSYGKKRALTNLFLEIGSGKIYGLLGPNGAGKSTLFKAILGLIKPNAGKVLVEGQSIETQRKKVVYLPQKTEVDWDFPATVAEIVATGRYPHKKLLQRLDKHDHELTMEALHEVGMEQYSKRQIGELSGGQQQRVFLARALCQQAEIFLLDEPFVGVDATTEEKIMQILKRLASEGKTLLVVHHDLSSVPKYFDCVILINQRLIAFGPTGTAFTKENITQAYSGQLPILHQAGAWGA
jgi:ABC-type Mn2+/Zn2+ transport system ATPase subunit